jgi:hypothetical protein
VIKLFLHQAGCPTLNEALNTFKSIQSPISGKEEDRKEEEAN